nr:integrase, catalytic region, zinc finger, CCHC-type, peptidase aspartic, catalytic [Tanacetum cinerariifolium]
TRPVQTRRQLATDPEMCMYVLTVSTAEPKNIKEAMADSAWIKAMQKELHQFDRLQCSSELGLYDHNNEQSSSKLVPNVVPPADKKATSRQVLELLFHHHITMMRKTTIKDVCC